MAGPLGWLLRAVAARDGSKLRKERLQERLQRRGLPLTALAAGGRAKAGELQPAAGLQPLEELGGLGRRVGAELVPQARGEVAVGAEGRGPLPELREAAHEPPAGLLVQLVGGEEPAPGIHRIAVPACSSVSGGERREALGMTRLEPIPQLEVPVAHRLALEERAAVEGERGL